MPAFVNVPWLPTSEQFLQAMEAGSRVGQQREQRQHEVQMELLRQPPASGTVPNPLAASAQQWRQQYEQGLLADESEKNRIAQERIDSEKSTSQNHVQIVPLGRGGVGLYNFGTKTFTPLREPSPIAKPAEHRYTIPAAVDIMGKPTSTLSVTPSERNSPQFDMLPEFARTNAISQFVRGLGQVNTSAPSGEIIRTTKDGRKAIFDSQTKQFLRYAD